MQIILRRLAIGAGDQQQFEPLQLGYQEGNEEDAGMLCNISSATDQDTCFYYVDLPSHLYVQPVDWRRFAYDHAKVAQLMGDCVNDNAGAFAFAGNNEDNFAALKDCLGLALYDLSALFDLNEVSTDMQPDGRVTVTVNVDHKNGENKSYLFALAR